MNNKKVSTIVKFLITLLLIIGTIFLGKSFSADNEKLIIEGMLEKYLNYNLENGEWYSKEVIGIDKGISMMMIENYLSQLLWKHFMKNEYIQKGLEILNIKKKSYIESQIA